MTRVLLLSTTTGYQLRSFDDAAEAAGHRARVRHRPVSSARRPVARSRDRRPLSRGSAVARGDRRARSPFHGVVAVGDRPAILAARVAERLGLPGNPAHAAAASGNKLEARRRLAAAGLAVPSYFTLPVGIGGQRAAEIRASRFPASSSPWGCQAAAASSAPTRARSSRRRSIASRALLARVDVRAATDRARKRRPRRELHSRTRGRRRGGADGRSAAGVRHLRQAGSARRSLLRGDDLRDAVVARRGEPDRPGGDDSAGDRCARAAGTGPSTPNAG